MFLVNIQLHYALHSRKKRQAKEQSQASKLRNAMPPKQFHHPGPISPSVIHSSPGHNTPFSPAAQYHSPAASIVSTLDLTRDTHHVRAKPPSKDQKDQKDHSINTVQKKHYIPCTATTAAAEPSSPLLRFRLFRTSRLRKTLYSNHPATQLGAYSPPVSPDAKSGLVRGLALRAISRIAHCCRSGLMWCQK